MLSDFGLLESSSEGRYTLHQTIADYARLHYHERAAQERLIAYVVAYLQAHRKDYELIERESATILAALDNGAVDLADLAEALGVPAGSLLAPARRFGTF